MKRLSVLLLCWNHKQYLDKCISSLAKQTSKDFEIIFLDNASRDGSFEHAKSLFDEHGLTATMLQNEYPAGISHNLNKLLEQASGAWVTPLSTDDWYHPRYVEKIPAASECGRETVLIYPLRCNYYPEGKYYEKEDSVGYVEGDLLPSIQEGRFRMNLVGCCYRRQTLIDIEGWDEEFAIEDIDMICRLALIGWVKCVDERLVYYRKVPGSASSNLRLLAQGWETFYRKHGWLFLHDGADRLAETYRVYAAMSVDQNDFATAKEFLRKSLSIKPLQPKALRTAFYLWRKKLRKRRHR